MCSKMVTGLPLQGTALDESVIAVVVRDVLKALVYLHAHGLDPEP